MLEIDLLEYETDDCTLCQNCNQNINAGDSCGNCKQKMFMEFKKLKRFPLKIEQEPSIIFECSGNKYYFSEDGQYSATITFDNNLIKVFSFIEQKEFKVIKMSRKLNIDQMVFSQDNTILLLKTKFLQKVLINVYGIQFDYHKEFSFENQKLLTFWTRNNAIYFLLTNKKDYQLLLYSINLQMNGLVLKQNLPFLCMHGQNRICANNINYFYMINQHHFQIRSKCNLKVLYQIKLQNITSIKENKNGLYFMEHYKQLKPILIKDKLNHKLIRKFIGFPEESILFQNLYVSHHSFFCSLMRFYDIQIGQNILQIKTEATGTLTIIGDFLAFQVGGVFKGWKQLE